MATNSFRKGTEPPPHQYRTPSPPTYAFEPLSPSEFDSPGYALGNKRRVETEVQNVRTRIMLEKEKVTCHLSNVQTPTIMDTFASIALAADPSRPSDSEAELLLNFSQAAHSTAPRLSLQGYLGTRRERQLPYTFEGQCAERPSKRARSEKLPSPEWHRTVSRPFTSYIQPQKCDSFLMPCRLVTGKDSYGLAPYISARHQQTDSQARSEDSVASGTGTAEQSEPLITRWSDQDVGVDNLHRTQDIRFAQLVATAAHVPPSHEAALEIGTFHEDSTTTVKDMGEMNRLSPLHVPRSPERFRSPIQYDAMLEARPRDLEDQPLTRDFSIIENSKIYFRDDQSTSTSMSACAEDSALAEGRVQAIEDKLTTAPNQQDVSGKPGNDLSASLETAISALEHKARQAAAPSICAACKFTRNSLTLETENNATSWIRCDACKSWFHFACAGFKSEREVRAVDKYRCRECKSLHGATTYVRKSSRAHAAIDYAGLNEGVLKSSDENPEHHYIKPIKEGIIKFNPEVFPRMRPELVTAEYFQQLGSFTQPVVIPALFNPRPGSTSPPQAGDDEPRHEDIIGEKLTEQSADNPVCYSHGYEHKIVPDHGQDALDMVLPQNLTVRKVAELYGPEEKVEVIDVKSQNGEDKKWNMRRWADYYESQGNKVVRNVISLEVSQSKLGRLIRRPKIVRDLDLQDSVWPAELQAKGEFPKVQFYCLMSVADCFTDFHIDFGGSSVFYHILKGKKTFFFIPPHEKHLKKYEEWCMSPAQNWTFLGDQTKECYRVDLSEGDTMLIPAGWIHAVWTPEDSLVIGGNFLTRMHYGMQINIAKIEKSTGVARKFRYPHFQKILWYTAIRYLEDDPLPDSVMEDLLRGNVFTREKPTHHEYVNPGEEFTDPERHHARYYSQAELDGLPDLGRYLLRTASIAMGYITEGISSETRNAVKRSIPKINAEPLDIVKKFGVWCAWKRGNEHIPHWARPDHVPEDGAPESGEKKLSAKAIRRLDREAALQAYRVAPERQSTRKRNQPQISTLESIERSKESSENPYQSVSETQSPGPNLQLGTGETFARKRKSIAGQPNSSPRKPACETCRKRRRACKHKDEVAPAFTLGLEHTAEASTVFNSKPIISIPSTTLTAYFGDWHAGSVKTDDTPNPSDNAKASDASNESMENGRRTLQMSHVEIVRTKSDSIHIPPELSVTEKATLPTAPQTPASKTVFNALASTEDLTGGSGASRSQARSKACKDCRKSKVKNDHYPLMYVY